MGSGRNEVVYAVVQRPLWNDPDDADAGYVDGADVARIGRYEVKTGTWSWFGYQLQSTSTPGDWIGLSEVTAVDHNTLAVVERDKLNGPAARIKRIYAVDLPTRPNHSGDLPVLRKRLAVDLLPALRDPNGWTQETVGRVEPLAAVLSCPGWTVADLLGHVGQMHRWGCVPEVFSRCGQWPRRA